MDKIKRIRKKADVFPVKMKRDMGENPTEAGGRVNDICKVDNLSHMKSKGWNFQGKCMYIMDN